MFKVPNNHRLRIHKTMGSDDSYGNNGVFIIPFMGQSINCIASDQEGWEHVSVTLDGGKETPSWEIMCAVKDWFWDGEDSVIQYHPPKSLYVNQHPHCLHLWRPIDVEMPLPDRKLIKA